MTKVYRARVKMKGGIYPTTVTARSTAEARIMLEHLHGTGSVISIDP
jgi:hypothetical protein